MRHITMARAAGAAFTAAALALVPAVVVSTAAAADEPVAVYTHDFEDGTDGGWQGRSATVDVIDTDGHESTSSLLTTGLTESWSGAQLPVDSLITDGTYEVSLWVKLAPGETAAELNMGMQQPGAENEYPWVGGRVEVTDAAWTQLSGSYTVLPDTPPTTLYIETATAGTEFLVDDVVITGIPPAPAEPVTVWELDFDDESHEPWTNNGGTLTYVDDGDGGQALSIERSQDYHGIKSPVGVIDHGKVYTFSMRARLPEGATGTQDIRFVVEPLYSWVGNTTVDADGWTEVTGTYTLPETDGDDNPVDQTQSAVYIGTSGDADESYTILVDDIVVTEPAPVTDYTPVDLTWDFEDGTLGDWVARGTDRGDPTVDVTTPGHDDSDYAALVTDRNDQGNGIGIDLSEVLETGITYNLTAWVRLGETATDDLVLSMQRGDSTFDNIVTVENVNGDEWTELTVEFPFAGGEMAFLYFESPWADGEVGTTYDFMVDDVTLVSQEPSPVQTDLTPIMDTVPWPVGVAVDSRETVAGPAELTLHHFDQITAENHMKVEAWYEGGSWEDFAVHPDAVALMDFAVENDLRVYGHVLAWHSQTPEWFFQDENGDPLTDGEDDKAIMRERLHDHIFNVADALSAWGEYGGENPLVAWDVVNEVVSDSGEYADGLRRSEWYRILGEEFIDLAFQYADEAFNDAYAAEGTDRPVTLFINDYNTEQSGKQDRYYALVERLVGRGVPIDGVGHQFHVNLSMPVSALETAIVRFQDLGLIQAVTELDVTVGTPVTQANIIEQGYYYQDAFTVFREYADDLFSVTIWGLTDNRSWRDTQRPLVFDGQLQAKPAYYGIVDGELPARIRTANVFQAGEGTDTIDSVVWSQLPMHAIGEVAEFQARWAPDTLTVYVEVDDSQADAEDEVQVQIGDDGGTVVTVGRDGSVSEGVTATVEETDDGYVVLADVVLDPAVAEGDTLAADVRVVDGASAAGWATAGSTGTMTLVEQLSYVEVVEAPETPVIDGELDTAWDEANVVTTDKQVSGTDTAPADVRTLWSGSTLYVLMEITDPVLDVTGSDPWTQDSVEIYVDAGNAKNGPYRYDDTQIRINVENAVSFGTGDEAYQANRLESATSVTDDGYIVEAAIDLLEYGGAGTFHGLDFQVNDAADGARAGIRNWADPTGTGYQSTARWGVGQLVATEEPPVVDPTIALGSRLVVAGRTLPVEVTGFTPDSEVALTLETWLNVRPGHGHGRNRPVELGEVTVGPDGAGSVDVTIPRQTSLGLYRVVATQDDVRVSTWVVVLPKRWGWWQTNGRWSF